MNESEFISMAVSQFYPGEIVVVSGKNPVLTPAMLCRVKAALELAGKSALVIGADTFVGYPNDMFIGSQFWTPREYYNKGVTVFPTAYVDDDVLYNIPINCSPTILPRFKYTCTKNGMSGGTEPTWPLIEGTAISDNQTAWKTTQITVAELSWEMILLNSRKGNGCIVLVHNEFDPNGPRALTGNLINDVVLDLAQGFGPGGKMLKHKAYRTRDLFPYFSRLFYYDHPDIQFIKNQIPDR